MECSVSPLRGEWIEIVESLELHHMIPVSPLRGEWIEIGATCTRTSSLWVSPLRGEWIEMKETKAAKEKAARLASQRRVD